MTPFQRFIAEYTATQLKKAVECCDLKGERGGTLCSECPLHSTYDCEFHLKQHLINLGLEALESTPD